MVRKKKDEKWGHPRHLIRRKEGEWVIGTREFVCTDNTSFWQYKVAREHAFNDQWSSIIGWVSKPTSRAKREFVSRAEADAAAMIALARLEEVFNASSKSVPSTISA